MARDIKLIEEDMIRLVRDLPTVVGAQAVNFYKDSWRKQGFTDRTLEKWPDRKTAKGARASRRAILVKSGRLRRSIRVTQKTAEYVKIGTDVPYAKAHNEGETINVPGRTSKVRHRLDKDGNLMNQTQIGTGPHLKRKEKLLVFAKGNHKRARETEVRIPAYSIKMPQRQFMGRSKALDRLIEKNLTAKIKAIFK